MKSGKLSRRTFLQATAAVAVASKLKPAQAQTAQPYPENGTLIPDEGWHLWIDREAEWKNDEIFLPEDIAQDADGVVRGKGKPLPVNLPTGGWASLSVAASKEVILPSTVEQHYWGAFGHRSYTPEEYRYAADDPIPQNGAYLGVSWWHRQIDIPASMQGKRIFLHVRGARLRAEVFVNRKLVGYSLMEELPFECDITHAADPGGFNLIAIRITNPCGRYDWVDGLNAQWGAVKLYRSHGFGGLDRGMTISAHDSVRIKDAWVLNTPDPGKIAVCVNTVETVQRRVAELPPHVVTFELIDPTSGKVLETKNTEWAGAASDSFRVWGSIPPTKSQREALVSYPSLIRQTLTFSNVERWDIEDPKLYHLRIQIKRTSETVETRTIPFGFRSFGPTGLGKDAMFRLNGRRMKLYSAISWGYWGLNGLFPTPELAEKEVTQAKKLNLNCLNFHRNVGKEEVFRVHDRLGLLRYMEPGAGKMAIGKLPSGVAANAASIVMEKPPNEADKFAQRFMFVKCVEMVKAFRSHPSLIQYTLQNEIGADLKNPDTLAVLAAMRAEDPSRSIVLNDGFVAPPRKAAQAWYEPWNDKLHRSDEEPWGDWWNQHQGAGDQWYDSFYKSPTEFTYQAPYKDVITEFGEMEGCATPDNHSLMVHQITETYKKYGGTSYDLVDHKEIIAGYDKFLDRWGFRKAFPATESLWLSLGSKCYDTWQNYLENARISDELDFAVISGWESTAIENHSGIVDNLRNFKSDPAPISQTLQPVHPVAKQRSACVARGEAAVFDLYLLNDTGKPATGTLAFSVVAPSGKLLKLASFSAPAQSPDQFSYLLKEGFRTPPLTEDGLYRFRFALSSAPLAAQTKEIWVTGVPKHHQGRLRTIALSGVTSEARRQLIELGAKMGIRVEDFASGSKYDAIVSSGLTATSSAHQQAGDTTGLEAQPASVVGPVETTKQLGQLDPAVVEAVKAGTPLLAMPQADTLSEGVARQLADSGSFQYRGAVGDFRAPWMGNWYFVREHPVYAGLPVNQTMGIFYQAKGRESNGLLVDGNIEIIAAYSRDHDRNVGAGTFGCRLGQGKVLYHRIPEFHPVTQQRFLANALLWLTTDARG
ncbi:sugar-binding domain-containing protein [Edaphobacter sp.]|uniref:sugar-binding domain-containing protein n=1 Tax=Edaphobacter sp. TaxID=1934404 RepID=UPI002DB65E86|nr:sugar-binding domain-containing protein [Edaphobacter sp.]HEU5340245.1 glycoside hydrolase [Edaphobacter sp.]